MPASAATRAPLAIEGGSPLRSRMLPYGRQHVDDADVRAVNAALKSDWLTTGPRVEEFERDFASYVGCEHAVAVSSGTAALHVMLAALDLRPGDEVLVPAMTFAASANAVLYCGAKPVIVDVEANTLLIDTRDAAKKISSRTRALLAVDYAGQPCDYDALRAWCRAENLELVADACHSLGARWNGQSVSTLARASSFSFHAVKHLTCGEGGMVATNDAWIARRARRLRNHGIDSDHRQRERQGTWRYAMEELGFNYRLSDVACALGSSQLLRAERRLERRRELAGFYSRRLAKLDLVRPLAQNAKALHAWHLFVVELKLERLRVDRDAIFSALRAEGIGCQVHYLPVHLHPFYRRELGLARGLCPIAERAHERILSLPLFPEMTDSDARDVVRALEKVLSAYSR
jgi:perosamine synthetase